MGLSLERLVRRLASTVREAVPGSERDNEFRDRAYQCRSCGTRYERRHQVCPACDGFRVERREW